MIYNTAGTCLISYDHFCIYVLSSFSFSPFPTGMNLLSIVCIAVFAKQYLNCVAVFDFW